MARHSLLLGLILKAMNILVTGSAGFIGSCFVRMLFGHTRKKSSEWPSLGPADQVVSLDLLTYAASTENFSVLSNEKRHKFVKGDICDRKLIESLVKEHRIDTLINFAAESHVDRSILGSGIFAQTNVLGTLNLLEIAKEHQLRYLQVSTDEVYGALGPTGSFTETTPMEPNSPYSASKAAADCFVRAYVHTHNLHAIITRCSNNYGPYQFPEKFLPLSITRLMKGGKIPVYGAGTNVRDWIHVEDHCYGVWLALTRGKPGEVYNFGGHGEKSNIEVARILTAMLRPGVPDAIEFVEDRKGHDFRYSIDPSKAKRELGWAPQWTFEEGLKDMVAWYKENEAWWRPKLL